MENENNIKQSTYEPIYHNDLRHFTYSKYADEEIIDVISVIFPREFKTWKDDNEDKLEKIQFLSVLFNITIHRLDKLLNEIDYYLKHVLIDFKEENGKVNLIIHYGIIETPFTNQNENSVFQSFIYHMVHTNPITIEKDFSTPNDFLKELENKSLAAPTPEELESIKTFVKDKIESYKKRFSNNYQFDQSIEDFILLNGVIFNEDRTTMPRYILEKIRSKEMDIETYYDDDNLSYFSMDSESYDTIITKKFEDLFYFIPQINKFANREIDIDFNDEDYSYCFYNDSIKNLVMNPNTIPYGFDILEKNTKENPPENE